MLNAEIALRNKQPLLIVNRGLLAARVQTPNLPTRYQALRHSLIGTWIDMGFSLESDGGSVFHPRSDVHYRVHVTGTIVLSTDFFPPILFNTLRPYMIACGLPRIKAVSIRLYRSTSDIAPS